MSTTTIGGNNIHLTSSAATTSTTPICRGSRPASFRAFTWSPGRRSATSETRAMQGHPAAPAFQVPPPRRPGRRSHAVSRRLARGRSPREHKPGARRRPWRRRRRPAADDRPSSAAGVQQAAEGFAALQDGLTSGPRNGRPAAARSASAARPCFWPTRPGHCSSSASTWGPCCCPEAHGRAAQATARGVEAASGASGLERLSGTRTRGLQLGKLTRYQLRYIRTGPTVHHTGRRCFKVGRSRRGAPFLGPEYARHTGAR